MTMTFDSARKCIVRFGKYAAMTIDEIAQSDEGLRYLDWLRGEREGKKSFLDDALAAYLDDPTIKDELNALGDE
jgi:hypothetical protein